ncbi:hypothetical protein BBO99_00001077 [Phytophthora kernoviae]|uniref:Protein kinase n=2 Tax=Phytophthora kernoviae TaxID=325452 RepID=A0A3R7I141_9STRA|nr:hypothetical protein G195_004027 [Phytophthora kernoviae 00238/432]KAG2532399.1 hypothetical protein JM16_000380 [Phytophthora kernoviae]KAG2533469.1 hypothetical protein JM18_000297 [Phytophthora kernoviae]RLN06718.1 hypothetical protein BBI17_001048 [Phytophthora kernoviae]RLN84730.1 hypothetical protein BBO99_00001077 [Phytophthora kernoviae]
MTFAPTAVETLRPTPSKPVSPSATATQPKRRAGASPSSVKDRTVVVFDWDDTLCPSSWLHAENLLPKYRGHQIAVTQDQRAVLALIGDHVARLLQKAAAYGPVFVVTAAEHGWVEMSCALYLPAVQEVLAMSDVHIVSARSWYEQTFGLGGDSATWKQEVMQLIARKCFAAAAQENSVRTYPEANDTYFNFVSVGDSMAERDACVAAVANVGHTFAKTLKFVEHPNAEEVLQQVELTHDSFEQMCGSWRINVWKKLHDNDKKS